MNISGIDYNLNYKALEIYISGCTLHCKGCHNYEIWDFNSGKPYFGYWDKIILSKMRDPMIENIWVMGGEPLDQNINLFVDFLKDICYKPIWLWTGYEKLEKTMYNKINIYLSYIKIGSYKKELPGYIEPLLGLELASSNQKLIKV